MRGSSERGRRRGNPAAPLACEAAAHSDQLDWARARAERAFREVTDPAIQARLIQVRAGADFIQGAFHNAHGLLTGGASPDRGKEPVRASCVLMEALHSAWAAHGPAVDRRDD